MPATTREFKGLLLFDLEGVRAPLLSRIDVDFGARLVVCVLRERGRPGARVHMAACRRDAVQRDRYSEGLRGVALDKAARVCVRAAPPSTVAPASVYAPKEASYKTAARDAPVAT